MGVLAHPPLYKIFFVFRKTNSLTPNPLLMVRKIFVLVLKFGNFFHVRKFFHIALANFPVCSTIYMKILHINLINARIDVRELTEKLSNLGIQVSFLSDLGFCPHFICTQNPEDNEFFVDNTNEGHYDYLCREHEIIDCRDVDEFIAQVAVMKGNVVLSDKKKQKEEINSNALF